MIHRAPNQIVYPRLLRSMPWGATERYLRLVPQYSKLQDIRPVTLAIDQIESLARYVRHYRLAFAHSIFTQMLERNYELYESVVIELADHKRFVVPPVVEKHDERYILFDGTHRIWVAREYGVPCLQVVCVFNIDLSLPCETVPWEHVTTREDYYTTEENLVNLDRKLFRPVTTTFNGPSTILEIKDELK